MAFIYDFKIYDNFQNKGFGSKALQLTTQEAKLKGFSSIALHVFGSNKRAIHVYEKNGFTTTDITMQKTLIQSFLLQGYQINVYVNIALQSNAASTFTDTIK